MESQNALSLKDYEKVARTAHSQRNLIKRLIALPGHKIPATKYVKNNKDIKLKNTCLPKLL